MTATEFHEWVVFYQLEKEDHEAEIVKARAEAKAEVEAERNRQT